MVWGVVTSLLFAVVAASQSLPPQEPYDLLIRNGRVLDGSGNPWRFADIAISGNRVAAIGDLSAVEAGRIVDATGLYVSPGFIDVHSHAGRGLLAEELSAARPLLAQGVTTVFVNPDGGGPIDLAEQRAALLEHGLGVNVAQLVPHGSIRSEVLGMEDRAPTPEELERMKALARAGMEEGAFGLSSGLYYAPGSYATTEEVIELAKVVGEYGGVYTSHIRDEADYNIGVVAAVEEVIRIAREADIPGVVSHIKALGPRVWGYSMAMAERIQRARDEGVQVYADQYAYEASGTSITGALVPRWALVGGQDGLARRIEDPDERERLREGMRENLERRGGASRLLISRHSADRSIEGKTLQQVADERDTEPVDLAMDLLAAEGAGFISFNMNEKDVELFMRQPWMMTSSDGGLVAMNEGRPHPRFYGAFPRKIRKYVVEDGVIDLAAAIRSMTSLSATVFGMKDRGVLSPGAIADIIIFDLERVDDAASYTQPHQLAAGMVHVLVSGQFSIEDGQFTGGLHGRVLSRRSDRKVTRAAGG